ncbi:branched chain amino acid ABC transporter substrate-binding protein [Actinokineospora bangkokensis]|uniref:Branched chain amino acid ABC transporter substrate-binding protein n=1 Tax=Actinokineospora bangkokensis TaxID=1193682 RepID=A0A1Q9LPY0_9PSEU|nr:branched chain amino acid ABC transporter substrate-binding protein [Actinokineospora bangkokensis]
MVLVVAGFVFVPKLFDGQAPTGLAGGGSPSSSAEAPAVQAAGTCDTSRGTLSVGLIAPLSGDLSALGLGIKNSAGLAVEQANQRCAVPGYRLALKAQDDQATPEVGARAATALAGDTAVVGVVGTLNSSVAMATAPVLAAKGIAQVSPANTADAVTHDASGLSRRFPNYFRVVGVDSLQGPFAAEHLASRGIRSVAVVDDGLTYGVGLATTFTARAKALGITVVAEQRVSDRDTDFTEVVRVVGAARPQAVYFGGQYPQGGPLSKQLAGLGVPLVGGDGDFDTQYVELGGRDGDLATSVGAPAEELSGAREFVEAYADADYREAYTVYGPFAYDATNVIIESTAAALRGGDWSTAKRADVVQAIGRHSADGITGRISFDEFGDIEDPVLSVYRVSGGRWVTEHTGVATR